MKLPFTSPYSPSALGSRSPTLGARPGWGAELDGRRRTLPQHARARKLEFPTAQVNNLAGEWPSLELNAGDRVPIDARAYATRSAWASWVALCWTGGGAGREGPLPCCRMRQETDFGTPCLR